MYCVVDLDEIMTGMTGYLGMHFTNEEVFLMTQHIDKDKNGLIDYQEFSEKINFYDYQQRSAKYTISLKLFIEKVLAEWYEF